MIEVIWDGRFKRAYHKSIIRNPEIDDIFWEKIEFLQENPYHPFF